MLIHLHRLRDRGQPIPKYQFAFKPTEHGELTLREERDVVLNRYTRIAQLRACDSSAALLVPRLLDAQLLELTRERMVLSGIERHEDAAILKIEDFAQTWGCWLSPYL